MHIRAHAEHYSRKRRKREKNEYIYNFKNSNLFRVKLVYYNK